MCWMYAWDCIRPFWKLPIIVYRTWSIILPVEITPVLLFLLCFYELLWVSSNLHLPLHPWSAKKPPCLNVPTEKYILSHNKINSWLLLRIQCARPCPMSFLYMISFHLEFCQKLWLSPVSISGNRRWDIPKITQLANSWLSSSIHLSINTFK
jgi:hypothetical protein